MSHYSVLERKIANLLESTPFLRDLIRFSYKRLVYLINRKNYKLKLIGDFSVIDLASKCGIENYDAFFFGYYDKSPWDKSGEYYISHLLKNNKCSIVVCEPKKGTYEIIAETMAWNYQQGSMTQWFPGTYKILYNDYSNSELGCIVYDYETKSSSFIPFPVQVVNPIHKEYLSLNYRRLAVLRPDYGYFTDCSNFSSDQDYKEDGIWKVDLNTSESELIISIYELIQDTDEKYHKSNHKVNHCYYSPNGDNFVFLHRWLDKSGKHSRLIYADRNGNNRKILLDHRMISHYSWIDNEHLIVWARTPEHGDCYVIVSSKTGEYEQLDNGELTKFGDGHPTIDSKRKNIITDTYPNKGRIRTLLNYNLEDNSTKVMGEFFSSWKFEDEKRCDLHPRWHPDKQLLSIDSAHEGKRKNYIIEL